MTWEYETFGPDGQCRLFGVNIFDYDWQTTGKRVKVQDPTITRTTPLRSGGWRSAGRSTALPLGSSPTACGDSIWKRTDKRSVERMSRITDKPCFTYSAYSALTTGIQVKCPKCHGAGVVTADEDNAYFRCLSCGHQMTQDRTVYRYDVHNQCKNCGRYYRVDIEEDRKSVV